MDDNKKQSGLSWSQPPMPNQSAQSKPASSPSGLGATPAAMQKPITPVQPMKPSTPMRTSQPQARSATGKVVGGFIAGLIIGALITTIWFTSDNSGSAATSNTSTTTTMANTSGTVTTGTTATAGDTATGASMLPSASLSIANPQDAGMQVVVNSANVSAATWLVVYESSNGQPTRILGASIFFPENNGKGASIPLLRATQSGQTYIVGERVDDGDHKLSLTLDKPVVDGAGNPVWSTFTTR